jgi:hypothetical protein
MQILLASVATSKILLAIASDENFVPNGPQLSTITTRAYHLFTKVGTDITTNKEIIQPHTRASMKAEDKFFLSYMNINQESPARKLPWTPRFPFIPFSQGSFSLGRPFLA